MTNQKGTRFETALVDYLRPRGAPHAERRARSGAKDKGDLAGIPGLVVEAKNATRMELAAWIAEAETERANADAELAVVWAKRKGKGSPRDGYVVMTGAQFVHLLQVAAFLDRSAATEEP